jgi:hypothetical protein
MGSTGAVAQATFVPVGEAAAAGAIGGAGATVGAAVAGGTALTLAAPLVLMAVAVGASAAADYQRQQAIEHITELLEQLHEQKLDDERNELDGCRDAIDKATAILLDEGKLGVSLGLDSAVYEISKALAAADRRLAQWQNALDKLPDVKAVDVDVLASRFVASKTTVARFAGTSNSRPWLLRSSGGSSCSRRWNTRSSTRATSSRTSLVHSEPTSGVLMSSSRESRASLCAWRRWSWHANGVCARRSSRLAKLIAYCAPHTGSTRWVTA